MSRFLSAFLVALTATFLTACEPTESADPFALSGNSEGLTPVTAGPLGADDVGVLRFLNASDTSFELLDTKVGLDARAARALVSHRDGLDGQPDTQDDNIFNSIDEVDGVFHVGPATLDRLFEYTLENGMSEGGEIVAHDGVTFTTLEMQQVLRAANAASAFQLDEMAGLDSRASAGLIAGRPFANLRAVSDAHHVGPAALRKLKVYAPKFSRIAR